MAIEQPDYSCRTMRVIVLAVASYCPGQCFLLPQDNASYCPRTMLLIVPPMVSLSRIQLPTWSRYCVDYSNHSHPRFRWNPNLDSSRTIPSYPLGDCDICGLSRLVYQSTDGKYNPCIRTVIYLEAHNVVPNSSGVEPGQY